MLRRMRALPLKSAYWSRRRAMMWLAMAMVSVSVSIIAHSAGGGHSSKSGVCQSSIDISPTACTSKLRQTNTLLISTDCLAVAASILISTDCLSIKISLTACTSEVRQTNTLLISTDCLSVIPVKLSQYWQETQFTPRYTPE